MLKPRKTKTLGLALGSGGAKGISHLAFLRVLDEMGVRPAVMSGTSIGAIVGASWASGLSPGAMAEVIDSLGIVEFGRMLNLSLFSGTGILNTQGVEGFLRRLIKVETFEDLAVPLKVVATDFWSRRQVVFDSGPLIPAVHASMAVPALFEPVRFQDRILTDGGTVNPLPFDIIREDCDVLAAIDVSGTRVPEEHDPVPSMVDNVFASFQIMQAAIVRAMMEKSRPDIYVKPKLANIQLLEIHRRKEILRAVVEDAARFREELAAALA